jgi:hypothetical protein
MDVIHDLKPHFVYSRDLHLYNLEHGDDEFI